MLQTQTSDIQTEIKELSETRDVTVWSNEFVIHLLRSKKEKEIKMRKRQLEFWEVQTLQGRVGVAFTQEIKPTSMKVVKVVRSICNGTNIDQA